MGEMNGNGMAPKIMFWLMGVMAAILVGSATMMVTNQMNLMQRVTALEVEQRVTNAQLTSIRQEIRETNALLARFGTEPPGTWSQTRAGHSSR